MSTEQNKDIVRRYREAHNTNNLSQLDAIVAVDLVAHNLLPGLPPGLAGGKMVHMGGLASFPDLYVTTDDLIAEGDKVVERWTQSGAYTGSSFMGTPVTGKKYSVTGMSLYRLADGKIVEHWGEMNFLSVLQQLGLAPMPEQAVS
ncbi:MAG: ester cyclase [Ktedonobacteraceae bacterium]